MNARIAFAYGPGIALIAIQAARVPGIVLNGQWFRLVDVFTITILAVTIILANRTIEHLKGHRRPDPIEEARQELQAAEDELIRDLKKRNRR